MASEDFAIAFNVFGAANVAAAVEGENEDGLFAQILSHERLLRFCRASDLRPPALAGVGWHDKAQIIMFAIRCQIFSSISADLSDQ
jgi:hypothetical protein